MKIKNQFSGGRVIIPSSKSYHHRVLIANALALLQSTCAKTVRVKSVGICDDVWATIECLKKMGIEISVYDHPNGEQNKQKEEINATNGNLMIQMETKLPIGDSSFRLPLERSCDRTLSKSPSKPEAPLYFNAGESGSTLRFLIPVCLALNLDVRMDGKGSLRNRPLDDYLHLFRQKKIDVHYEGTLPLRIFPDQAHKLSGTLHIGTEVSSQYLSGLLFACALMQEPCLIVTGDRIYSGDYVNMTLEVLQRCGILYKKTQSGYVKSDQPMLYRPLTTMIEGDYSCAAFFIAAGILSKKVEIANLNPHSLQGDRKLLDVLKAAGARLGFQDDVLEIYPSRLHPMEINAQDIIDCVPVLCVLCACATGRSRIYNVKRLRTKESDRIRSSLEMICSLGGTASYEDEEDCIIIEGRGHLQGGRVRTYHDHRIAMSAAIAALACTEEVFIDDDQCVSKSYAEFFSDFKRLGGDYVL